MALLPTRTLTSTAQQHLDDTLQMYGKLNDFPNVVRDYGAGSGSGDDSGKFISACTDATAGNGGVVVVPGQHIYAMTNTFFRPPGVALVADGIGAGSASNQLPRLKWTGSSGGTLCETDSAAANIPGTPTIGIDFDAGGLANYAYRFAGTAGAAAKPDSWTLFDRCKFGNTLLDALRIDTKGITNMRITNTTRWDQMADGYGIYVDCNNGSVFLTIDGGCTFDNWLDGQVGCRGFLHLDGSSAIDNAEAMVKISDFHPEVNGDLQVTNAGGTTAPDQRGLIRCSVNPAIVSQKVQFEIGLSHVWFPTSANTESYSLIQMTGGTDAQNALALAAEGEQLHGFARWSSNTKWNRLIGGVDAATNGYYFEGANGAKQIGKFSFGARGTVSTEERVNWLDSWTMVRQLMVGHMAPSGAVGGIDIANGTPPSSDPTGGGWVGWEGGVLKARGPGFGGTKLVNLT